MKYFNDTSWCPIEQGDPRSTSAIFKKTTIILPPFRQSYYIIFLHPVLKKNAPTLYTNIYWVHMSIGKSGVWVQLPAWTWAHIMYRYAKPNLLREISLKHIFLKSKVSFHVLWLIIMHVNFSQLFTSRAAAESYVGVGGGGGQGRGDVLLFCLFLVWKSIWKCLNAYESI